VTRRRFRAAVLGAPFRSALRQYLSRCLFNRATVSLALDWVRVVGMRVKEAFGGRVGRNSSMRRVQMEKPRPLYVVSIGKSIDS